MSGFADSYLGQLRAALGQVPLLSVGARVLIEDGQGRFLILRRADNGLWGVPGGGMEVGESLLDTARREALEETNAGLRDLFAFGLSSDPVVEHYVYPNGDPVQSISLLTHADHDGGPLRATDGEATEFRFAAPGDIDPATFTPPEFPIFDHWARFRETGAFQVV
ncbi:NUDIX domain-containing protein [Jannaschia donghaensis]|uniref:NUDIX domain protein n=1 Tax=Jannaschia donghaensis TaxID=420998 RepID=A0A0M6YIJ4_9RHOB|nr:NUDIX domain-containing protein [Jannaschia donghaensis]CTQ50171.1 NUDIX domain protein [Jannaschia donghaensis]